MLRHPTLQWVLAAFIIIAAISTKWFTINYWQTQGITNVYPWFMPYIFLAWGFALLIRLYVEQSKLYSVYVMSLATIWYGFESMAVAG